MRGSRADAAKLSDADFLARATGSQTSTTSFLSTLKSTSSQDGLVGLQGHLINLHVGFQHGSIIRLAARDGVSLEPRAPCSRAYRWKLQARESRAEMPRLP